MFGRLLGNEDLEKRVLDFDSVAATESGIAGSHATKIPAAGRPCDTQIAGIVLARRATLATLKRHFRDLKISIVDPWAA